MVLETQSTRYRAFIEGLNMSRYLSDVVNAIRQSWNKYLPKRPLPPTSQLSTFFDVVLRASLMTEEGRRTRLRAAMMNFTDVNEHCNASGAHLVQLSRERSFNPAEMTRLAPALDSAQSIILVRTAKHQDTKLEIWGILSETSDWLRIVQDETRVHCDAPPDALTITCLGPGTLQLSRRGYPLAVYSDGKVGLPGPILVNIQPLKDFFNGPRRECTEAAKRHAREQKKRKDIENDAGEYTSVVGRILRNIAAHGHGGTLLIVPDELEADDTRLLDRMQLKYQCPYDKCWELLVRKVVKLKACRTWRDCQRVELDQGTRRLDESIAFIARNSCVDGAVIITTHFRLLGFGAEIIAKSPALKRIWVTRSEKGSNGRFVDIDTFGTRHRSAFRFCSEFEDGMAFVVSQDGGIKAVKRVGAKVVVWPDIRLMNVVV
jgi:hypothetical protein